MIFSKPLAFIRKDFLLDLSYRFDFALRAAGIFLSALIFFFIARLFGEAASPFLKDYGGDYFSFVLIGIAFSGYLSVGLNTFSISIRQEQMMGTLESILISPTRISTIIFSSSLWRFLSATLDTTIYLLLGFFCLGLKVGRVNIPGIIIILLLTILSFSTLGIISASFIIVFKRGDPVNWVLYNAFVFLGGVYFPVSILPPWARKISTLLPLTHSLRGLRHALLNGYSLGMLKNEILALLIFCIIMLPLSVLSFSFAVKRAKIDGSLAQY